MWRLYDQIDPIGDQPIRHLLASFCAIYLNAHLGKDAAPVSPYDFMPWAEKPAPPPPNEAEARRSVMRAGLMK